MLGKLHWVHRYFPLAYYFYRGMTFHLSHAGEIEDNTSAPGWRGELPEEEEGLLREVRKKKGGNLRKLARCSTPLNQIKIKQIEIKIKSCSLSSSPPSRRN